MCVCYLRKLVFCFYVLRPQKIVAEKKREERGMGRIIHDDTVFFLGVVVVGGGVLGGCGGEILNGLEKGGPHSFLNFEQG